MQLSSATVGSVLDSLIRAKQILTLLGIPFSRIGRSGTSASKSKQMEGNDGRGVGGNLEMGNFSHFSNLSPSSLRSILSLETAEKVKSLLVGWSRVRLEGMGRLSNGGVRAPSSASPSSLMESLLLFHRLDIFFFVLCTYAFLIYACCMDDS